MSFYTGSLLFTSVAALILGVFVFFKGKDKLPNVTLALVSVSVAFWCFGQFMGEAAGTKELVLFWTREGIAGAIFIPAFFLHFILSLVERARKEKKLLAVVYGAGLFLLISDFTTLFVVDVMPIPGFRFYPVPGRVYPFFAVYIFACFAYSFWRLGASYRQSSGDKHNQLLYIILASIIGFAGGITAFFPIWGVNFPVVTPFILPVYLLILVYTIVKHHLLDISVIVRAGLIYSTLTLLFAGFYVAAVLATNYCLSRFIHFNQAITLVLVVFVSVLVFQPLRNWIQQIVDRVFFQGEYRYQQTIADLSAENLRLFRGLLQSDKLAALGTISAGLAHEIKNPLASLKGMTQVLEENLDDPEFLKRYRGIVERQIERINNLVEQMLKAGQPQALALSTFSLAQPIEESLVLLESQCRKGNVTIEKNLPNLPLLEGDAAQLSQVFLNLFLNAIHAMPKGGTLLISARPQGPRAIRVEVSDTGEGIAADQLDKIFDPFFTTKEEGTGMGLAVAYRIITGHNGQIQVTSEMGKGTRFTIWLPIKRARSA